MPKILLVEDDLLFRRMLGDVLQKEGHEVSTASDGEIALKIFIDGNFDLIICDLIMPNKDGMELIIELRLNYPDVKIIAISGGDQNLDAATYLNVTKDIGANRILKKPFENSELVSMVEELLNT